MTVRRETFHRLTQESQFVRADLPMLEIHRASRMPSGNRRLPQIALGMIQPEFGLGRRIAGGAVREMQVVDPHAGENLQPDLTAPSDHQRNDIVPLIGQSPDVTPIRHTILPFVGQTALRRMLRFFSVSDVPFQPARIIGHA